MLRWLAVCAFGVMAIGGCSSDGAQNETAEAAATASSKESSAVSAAVAMADDLEGLTECASLWQSGDPVVTPSPFSQFTQINREIATLSEELGNQLIVGYGSGQSVYGRLTVMLSRRDPAALRAVREIDERYGDQDDICVEVPPVGYYDEPLRIATWSVADFSLPVSEHWSALTLEIGDECSGNERRYIQPPEVTYSDTEVQIVVRLDHVPWSLSQTLECSPPAIVLVELPEHPAGRPLVGPLQAQLPTTEPGPTATPSPPLPPGVDPPDPTAAVLLQQVLLAAGFEHIVGDAPYGPSWSATASWEGGRYDVTLVGPRSANTPPVDGCITALFRFDSDMPADARQAVLRAAACDGPSQDVGLTVAYEDCVREAGITPFEAQVFVDLFGTPLFLKTAPEVPAEIHNPCWEAIGGEPTGRSSYGGGVPIPLPTPTPGG